MAQQPIVTDQPYDGHDAEEGGTAMPKRELGFDDKTIRAQFVRKVFVTVGIMLGVVTLMCAIAFGHQPTFMFLRQNLWTYYLGYVLYFTVAIVLICSESLRRSYPTNLVMLGIMTVAMGYMISMITVHYTVESVLLALAITTVSCLGVAAFATVTKRDLTSLIGVMFIATLCLLLAGISILLITLFFGHIRLLYVVYASIGAFIFMIWLAIDIQTIMGGKKVELSPEEHILASIMIFLDIVQIFLFILRIFGKRS